MPVGPQQCFITIWPKQGACQTTKSHHPPSRLRVLCWSPGPPWTWTSVLTPSTSAICFKNRAFRVVSQPEQREIFKAPWEHEALFWSKLFFSPSILIRRKGINALLCLLCVRLYTSSKLKKKNWLKSQSLLSGNIQFSGRDRRLNQQLEFSVESADGREHWIL